MKVNRKIFWKEFKEKIDSTVSREQVDGLEFLLGKMEDDPFWVHIPQAAYALATVYHETAGSFQPVEEGYYLGKGAKAFQKKLRYFPYYGRGYVQLTWKANYEHAGSVLGIDLVKKPHLALDAEGAYKVLTYGMHQGWFTKKKLDDYIKGDKKEYENARRIINGKDKAGLIAGYARMFEQILKDSTGAPADKPAGRSDKGDNPATDPASELLSTPTPQTSVQSDVIEVEQLKPETTPPEDDKVDKAITKWSSRWAAIPAGVGMFFTGTFAWLKDSPVHIVLGLFGLAAVIAIAYFVPRAIIEAVRESRKDKLAEAERQRVHEMQMLQATSAASQDMNAIKFVPPATTVETGNPVPPSQEDLT